ncbi:Peroxisomal membrane protein 11B, partial [Gryllus bimaculatus]
MEIVVKLNNQTAGRDKLVRLFQYASKVAWHFMQEKRLSRQTIDRLKNLEYTFSSFRKLLRLGRFLDTLYGALSTLHYPDLTIRITCTLSKITNALYLLADHILWIGRTGLETCSERENLFFSLYIRSCLRSFRYWADVSFRNDRQNGNSASTTGLSEQLFSGGYIRNVLYLRSKCKFELACDVQHSFFRNSRVRENEGKVRQNEETAPPTTPELL